ncbi:MAG: MgtC/SapB family protein [Aquificae bacterium]|nr:MgtC/SapB family protein [Aquificota bacterium]
MESYPFPLWEAFLRIALAAGVGALVGLERERRRQPAGLRTHAVLAVGSAVVTLVSVYTVHAYGGPGADPSRIMAQIVSGIGFLGAGAILRFGTTVKGLTTAASLWSTAGLGMAVGVGMYATAAFALAVLLAFLSLVSKIERELIKTKGALLVKVKTDDPEAFLAFLREQLPEVRLKRLSKEDGSVVFSLPRKDYAKLEELVKRVKELELL